MSSCTKCNEIVTDSVPCGQCQGIFHYACAGLSENSYRKMGQEKRAQWRCVSCRNQPSETNTMAEVLQEIKSFRADFCTMKADFNAVKTDIHSTSQAIQDLTSKWSELETRFNGMDKRLTIVEEKLASLSSVQKNLDKAKDTITELMHENNMQDQFSRQNNVEISGIPSKSGENLFSVLNDICAVVGFKLSDTDVDTIHRVRPFTSPSGGTSSSGDGKQFSRPPSIVVRFTQRRRKDQLIAAVRARRVITTADIKLSGPLSNIYVNDHLTPTNKLLLKRAREFKTELNYMYLWVKDSKILMRKTDKSNIIRIARESDLKKIK